MTTSYYLPRQNSSRSARQVSPQHENVEVGTETQPEEGNHTNQNDNSKTAPPPEYSSSTTLDHDKYVDEKRNVDTVALPPTYQHQQRQQQNEEEEDITRQDYHHNIALYELTHRPATPPPFPETLPTRLEDQEPNEAARKRRKIIITSTISLVLSVLIIIIVVLGILLGICRQSPQHHQKNNTGITILPIGSDQNNTSDHPPTQTITVHQTDISTVTMTDSTTTTLSSLSFTNVTISNATTTATTTSATSSITTSTTEPSTSDANGCNSSNPPLSLSLSLSNTQCTFITPCNVTSGTTIQNNCRDFCHINYYSDNNVSTSSDPSTDSSSINFTFNPSEPGSVNLCNVVKNIGDSVINSSLRGRLEGCCSKCGCF